VVGQAATSGGHQLMASCGRRPAARSDRSLPQKRSPYIRQTTGRRRRDVERRSSSVRARQNSQRRQEINRKRRPVSEMGPMAWWSCVRATPTLCEIPAAEIQVALGWLCRGTVIDGIRGGDGPRRIGRGSKF